ncbi:MAG: heme exporter protein CcmB [Saprospiraceae bacterium]|nr:heme exporter protein CcmB [Saprospiraceae bacterium]
MALIREIGWLLKKELTLEYRMRYAISGILLYVLSTVFIVYISAVRIDGAVWNVLFWIIVLFASVNAITKSFQQESGQRQLYYYSLLDPRAVILAKGLYNCLLLLVLTLLTYACFSFVAGNPVKDAGPFFLAIFLGSLGFALTFTFISGIASKADNRATLMAILGFPLIIPILLTMVKMGAQSMGLIQGNSIRSDIATLVGIDLVLLAVSLLLFPFLWRD